MKTELVSDATSYQLIMDGVKCAIFVALMMTIAAEIIIKKSGICVW